MWYDIIASGFVGAGLYLAFFLQYLWRYRHDRSAIGIAGLLVMILIAVYGLVYDAVPSLLPFYMLSVALLWRNDMAVREQRRAGALLPAQLPPPLARSAA
jgi:hypothetical protein